MAVPKMAEESAFVRFPGLYRIEHLVQTQRVYLMGSALNCLLSIGFEVVMVLRARRCRRFCDGQNPTSQQLSTR